MGVIKTPAAFRASIETRLKQAVGSLPSPPREWLAPYDRLRTEEDLPWTELDDLHPAAAAFLDPVLAGDDGTWSSTEQRWLPA